MLHLIETEHLVCDPDYGTVWARGDTRIINICGESFCIVVHYLGSLRGGPDSTTDDLDIIQEWRDLQEFVSSNARK